MNHVLQVRVSVTNIGDCLLTLVPDETGVVILFPADGQTDESMRSRDEWWPDIRWEPVPLLEGQDQSRNFDILSKHSIIEPDEIVFTDLLLNLGRKPTMVQVQVQLCWEAPRSIWRFYKRRTWLYDFVDQIIPPGTKIYENGNADEIEATAGG